MAEKAKVQSYKIIWENNTFIQCVVGVNNCHLRQVEEKFGVLVGLRGNELFLQGEKHQIRKAVDVLNAAYDMAAKGHVLAPQDMSLILNASEPPVVHKALFSVGSKTICARNVTQKKMVQSLERNELVFALGAAGTGKTYLAVAYGVKCLMDGSVKRLVLARPAVEAGEHLGFLPGDMKEKVDPYMMPLYDALHDVLDLQRVRRLIELNKIEVAPLAFMRGRTLSKCFIVLDEAQNATQSQMKMFLTRLGEYSRMVVTGDPHQTDLPSSKKSGLVDATQRLKGLTNVGQVQFCRRDVVRHGLVSEILQAYDVQD